MCFLKLLELFKNDKVSGNSHVGGSSQGGSLLKYLGLFSIQCFIWRQTMVRAVDDGVEEGWRARPRVELWRC